MTTVGQVVVRALADLGVRHVFGIPGVHTLELFRDFRSSGIELVVTRHEQGAGYMADGYARTSGEPGVCVLVTGPGVTNVMTPLAQAYHDSVPVLVVASETAVTEQGKRRGSLHYLPDQVGLVSSITRAARSVKDGSELAGALVETWRHLETGRRGPAYLGIPTDVLKLPGLVITTAALGVEDDGPSDAELEPALQLLAASERPAILLGGGALDAGDEARALARALGAPVVLTGNAKGTVASSEPLCLGATLPFAPTRQLLEDADVVLLVGTELSDVDVIYSGVRLRFGGKVIRVDIDPLQLDSGVPATVGLAGDAARVLSALTARLPGAAPDETIAKVAKTVHEVLGTLDWTPQSVAHLPWLAALDTALPADRIIALDSTQLAYTALHALPMERPRSWLAPYGFGTLGAALPMAIGAKVARPDAAVTVVIGDGGLLFTATELGTAADLGIALPIIVWNNRGYGEIRDAFDRAGIERIGCDVSVRDLGGLGAAFGCATVRAKAPEELSAAIHVALKAAGPTLIEVLDSTA